jgi:hypothetical protein
MDTEPSPRQSPRLTVADVMTRDVVTATPETPFKHCGRCRLRSGPAAQDRGRGRSGRWLETRVTPALHGKVDLRSEVEILSRLTLGVEGVIGVESSVTFDFDDRHVKPPAEQRIGGS